MTILYMLIPLSLVLVVGAVAAFFWAVDSGQFDELDAAAESLFDDEGDDEGDAAGGTGARPGAVRPGFPPRA